MYESEKKIQPARPSLLAGSLITALGIFPFQGNYESGNRGARGEIRPSRLNFLFALVLKFLERQNFHSFVGPISAIKAFLDPQRDSLSLPEASTPRAHKFP